MRVGAAGSLTAVLLSDRIVMMTNGPSARIGEVLDVPLPRPRKRLEMASNQTYLKCRQRVLEFLYERFREYIEDRRQNPGNDILTHLATTTFPDGSIARSSPRNVVATRCSFASAWDAAIGVASFSSRHCTRFRPDS